MWAACTLSSGQGFTCMMMKNRINNSVSPPVWARQPVCPQAQSYAVTSAQTWHHMSLYDTWQLWDCLSIFHGALPGGWAEPRRRLAAAPGTLPGEPERACAGADGYSHLGSCPAVTGAVVLCSPAFSSQPSAVLASAQSLSMLTRCVAQLEPISWWYHGHGAAQSRPACSRLLHDAPRHQAVQAPGSTSEQGLTLCHCSWVASAPGRAHQTMLQPCTLRRRGAKSETPGQAWGTSPFSSP